MRNVVIYSLVALGLMAVAPIALAQAGYEPGRVLVSAGIGAGISGTYGTSAAPLMALSAEFGINNAISIGGSLGFSSSKYSQGYDYLGSEYSLSYGYTIVAARGSYHFAEMFDVANLDVYAGASLGYNRVSVKAKAGSSSEEAVAGSYALYGVHLGGRYFFSPRFAGFAELGYGISNVAAGVSMRF